MFEVKAFIFPALIVLALNRFNININSIKRRGAYSASITDRKNVCLHRRFIEKYKGIFGEKRAEIIRVIVLNWLIEQREVIKQK